MLPLLLETIESPHFRRFKLVFGGYEESTLGYIDLGNDWSSTEVQLLRLKTLERVEFGYTPTSKFIEPDPISDVIHDRLKAVLRPWRAKTYYTDEAFVVCINDGKRRIFWIGSQKLCIRRTSVRLRVQYHVPSVSTPCCLDRVLCLTFEFECNNDRCFGATP